MFLKSTPKLTHAALLAASVGLAASAQAVQAAVVGTATFSGTVETTGLFPSTGSTSFQAAGNNASANTPADKFPAFGVVAFDASPFSSLASTGVTASASLAASEFVSTSTSTGTNPGSVIDFYFAQSPQTTAAGLGDYDTNNEPGGFDAATFNADLVGSFTYANVANQLDTIPLTLSSADVAFINSTLTSGSGTFELFAVATGPTDSARYDGTFASALATLTLNGATAAPEPASLGLLAMGGLSLMIRRRVR